MKGIVLLLLTLQGYAEGINYCGEDKRFRVTKSNGSYTLELCISRDNCMELINFISRTNEQTCDYCRGITDGSDQDSNNKTTCEAHLDSFFSDYCENATFNQCTTSSPSTQQPITPTACTNEVVSRVTTKVITERVSVVYTSNNKQPTNSSELNSQMASTRALIAAIGVLTGILLVILALVTTGWMWTCWIMKKKTKETQLCKVCRDHESEEERFCPNQIYEMTTTQPAVGNAIEQLLHSQEENGQSNDGLRNKNNRGYYNVKRVGNFYKSEGSSNSNLRYERPTNRIESGESGEEHVHHAIEESEGDICQEPEKDIEAIEYESPVCH